MPGRLLIATGLLTGCCAVFAAAGSARVRLDDRAPVLRVAMIDRTARAAPRLLLRGTLVNSVPEKSEALFDFGAGDLHTLGVGGVVPGAGVIVAVERDGVRFQRDGALYEFTFNDSALNSSGSPVAAAGNFVVDTASNEETGENAADGGAGYVVPGNAGAPKPFNPLAENPAQDATPAPGTVIDTTDWDHLPRHQAPNRFQQH